MSKALYGCVAIARFAVQSMLRLRPQLAGSAVAVMEGARPHEKVCSVNAAAAALGVEVAMTRIEVETFAGVMVLQRSMTEEEAAERVLLEAISVFTPRMEKSAAGSGAWECVLDLSGTERLLGSAQVLGQKIVEHLRALGFEAHVALCPNVDAGHLFARDAAAWQREGGSVRVVAAEKLALALAPLPLDVLQLEEAERDRFRSWGISTLGELAALPELELIARMGQLGKRLHQQARGRLDHLLRPVEAPLALSEMMEFEEPLETLEPLLFCLNPMLEQLVLRAQSHALALAAVTVSLWLQQDADRVLGEREVAERKLVTVPERQVRAAEMVRARERAYPEIAFRRSAPAHPRKELPLAERIVRYGRLPKPAGMKRVAGKTAKEAAPPHALEALLRAEVGAQQCFRRTIRPAVPTLNRPLLLKMLQLDLESHSPAGAVVRVQVEAEPGKMGRIQLGLFTPPMPEPTRFEDTHARLVALVGAGNVGRVKALDTHAAESFVLERFVLPGPLTKAPPARAEESRPAAALRRMRPAVAVRVELEAEDQQRLKAFYFEARRFQVLRCYGPWRSSGDWWHTTVWSSDTWDVVGRAATQPGAEEGELLLCVIAHDLIRGGWQLEGIYD